MGKIIEPIRGSFEVILNRMFDLRGGDHQEQKASISRHIILVCTVILFTGLSSGCLKNRETLTREAPVISVTSVTQTEAYQPGSAQGSPYPGPTLQPGGTGGNSYPAPQSTPVPSQTPVRATSTPGNPSPTGSLEPYPLPGSSPTLLPTATEKIAGTQQNTPAASVVESTPSPTSAEAGFYLRPALPPPQNQFALVTIWHALGETQANLLMTVIRAFQDQMPNVRFNVLYVPLEDLRGRYESAAYEGEGPSLLIGPSEWGPHYYDEQLIEDLSPFLSTSLRQVIFTPAFGNGEYHQAVISLPFNMSGVVMYRNRQIIANAPRTFEELSEAAQQATHGGIVGSYLERGFYYSGAHFEGIGGQWTDPAGNPVFNQDGFGKALDWVNLLQTFNQIGPTEFNGNRDLDWFEQGKAGIIIDGTWNREILAAAIGEENLSIDPWPEYDGGHLAGYVKTDSLYLNANTGFISAEDQFATLQFMGYLLSPEVQKLFSGSGMVPVVSNIIVEDAFIQQSMGALSGGIAYPVGLPDEVRKAYWDTLDAAIYQVFEGLDSPSTGLQNAYDQISTRLDEIRQEP